MNNVSSPCKSVSHDALEGWPEQGVAVGLLKDPTDVQVNVVMVNVDLHQRSIHAQQVKMGIILVL